MSLKDAIGAAGIRHAHIVDDAYDKLPGAGLGEAEINTFIQAIDDANFTEVATLLGIAESEEGIVTALQTAEGAIRLYPERAKYGAPAEQLFQDFTQATKPEQERLQPLLDFLRSHGVECHTFGRSYEIDEQPAPQLLFVDLKLNEREIIVAEPISVVVKMKTRFPDADPLVFLMSTQENSLRAHRTEFRKRCELFSSQFEDLPKRMLATEQLLRRFVSHHVDAYPRVLKLREHVQAWDRAMKAAHQHLTDTMRSLDLPDYFVLHNTAMADGAEIGGYVLDLMLGYLGNEVERSVDLHAFAAALNKWDLKNLKRSRFNVAPLVGDIFSANMVHTTERLNAEHGRRFSPAYGYLNLGDIFFNRAEVQANAIKTARIVLTPVCDLARPESIAQRKASIFLCEGSVKKLTPTTDLIGDEEPPLDQVILRFGPNGMQYIIDWRKKRVHTWDYQEYEKLKQPDTFAWVHAGRLRQLYALQLQRVVFADLERVGTMRRPAPYAPHGVEVLVPKGVRWVHLPMNVVYSGDPAAGAISNDTASEDTTFILSDVMLRETFERLTEWLRHNDAEPCAERLRQLSECDVALDNLMFYVETRAQKQKAMKENDSNVYPLASTPLPEGLNPILAKSVVLAIQNDKTFGVGKPWAPENPAVLVFRYIKL